ncbi:hypothetical protein [Aquamicrobium terrae]
MKRHDGGGKIRAIRMAEEGEARGIEPVGRDRPWRAASAFSLSWYRPRAGWHDAA